MLVIPPLTIWHECSITKEKQQPWWFLSHQYAATVAVHIMNINFYMEHFVLCLLKILNLKNIPRIIYNSVSLHILRNRFFKATIQGSLQIFLYIDIRLFNFLMQLSAPNMELNAALCLLLYLMNVPVCAPPVSHETKWKHRVRNTKLLLTMNRVDYWVNGRGEQWMSERGHDDRLETVSESGEQWHAQVRAHLNGMQP